MNHIELHRARFAEGEQELSLLSDLTHVGDMLPAWDGGGLLNKAQLV